MRSCLSNSPVSSAISTPLIYLYETLLHDVSCSSSCCLSGHYTILWYSSISFVLFFWIICCFYLLICLFDWVFFVRLFVVLQPLSFSTRYFSAPIRRLRCPTILPLSLACSELRKRRTMKLVLLITVPFSSDLVFFLVDFVWFEFSSSDLVFFLFDFAWFEFNWFNEPLF